MQSGGPSHLETWDLKPEAPVEYRGDFGSIPTSIPGYRIGEYMPNLAKICHKLAILRSVYHDQTEHGQAVHVMFTGYKPTKPDPGNEFPSIGSIVSKELGPRPGGIPAYVATMSAWGSCDAGVPGRGTQSVPDLRLSAKPRLSRPQPGPAAGRRSGPAGGGGARCSSGSTISAAMPTPRASAAWTNSPSGPWSW